MSKIKLLPQYLVDEEGRHKSVLLTVEEYEALLERLEDLEDALTLDEAVKTSEGFRNLDEIETELKEKGRL